MILLMEPRDVSDDTRPSAMNRFKAFKFDDNYSKALDGRMVRRTLDLTRFFCFSFFRQNHRMPTVFNVHVALMGPV